MKNRVALVITSIADSSHPILNDYAKACFSKDIAFIVAGDTKSPGDFSIDHCDFLSIERQGQLPFKTAALTPHRSYTKKNIAYLHAIGKGAEIIIETDDDNVPFESFWEPRDQNLDGLMIENGSWTNIYRHFSQANIWPRGFSLRHLVSQPVNGRSFNVKSCYCPIQQGLADENPDVDAIYRLTLPLPLYFNQNEPVILGQHSICPFNSQNTTWFKEAFALLYLPSYCSFRMTDIWRSFIAQRIMWTCGWSLAFHGATVFQKRNDHDLMHDFEDEISGYINNERIVKDLINLELKEGKAYIYDNLKRCYTMLIDKKYVDEKEFILVDAWINDLQKLTK